VLANDIPPFDIDVPENGYRWWYFDGVSDCRTYGVVVIAFVGSVFSPYYYSARQRGRGDPRQFCAINIASYGPRANAWSMTERCARQLHTTPDLMRVGKNAVRKRDASVQIAIDDRTMPWLRRISGDINITAEHSSGRVFTLDEGRRHQWQPIAPSARINVALQRPGLNWQGDAYVDTNAGERPLEADFRRWNWSSVRKPGGGADIFYDVIERSDRRHSIALSADRFNQVSTRMAPATRTLHKSRWGVVRESQHGASASVIKTLEDAPFYARSLLSVDIAGESSVAMHESLSLERFSSAWVRLLLPFRMPRITR
jgi:carotenoid 1,2-hydratase